MADDDQKKRYENIARTAESVASQHRSDCGINMLATAIAMDARQRAASTSSGPAQVASDAYRSSWETTFGGKRATVGQA